MTAKMNRQSSLFLLVFLVCIHIGPVFTSVRKGIYGPEDNRYQPYDAPANEQLLGDATVAMIPKNVLTASPSCVEVIAPQEYGKAMELCNEERFFHEPVASFCGGTLIDDETLFTAGHCMETLLSPCLDEAFVFGFSLYSAADSTQRITSFPPEDVYLCKEVRYLADGTRDYAIVKLDRPVTNRKPVPLATQSPKINDTVMVIGHPSGLPRKIANRGRVMQDKWPIFFNTDLDTYGGNSGSGVFNTKGEFLGVLIRGGRDFTWNGTCYKSNVCSFYDSSDHACGGEFVTRHTVILDTYQRAKSGGACFGDVLISSNSVSGVISDGYGSQPYSSNISCNFDFWMKPGQQLVIKFTEFDVTGSGGCFVGDYVRVFDSNNAKLFDFCSESPPKLNEDIIIQSVYHTSIQFKTSATSQGAGGWTLEYKFVGDAANDTCLSGEGTCPSGTQCLAFPDGSYACANPASNPATETYECSTTRAILAQSKDSHGVPVPDADAAQPASEESECLDCSPGTGTDTDTDTDTDTGITYYGVLASLGLLASLGAAVYYRRTRSRYHRVTASDLAEPLLAKSDRSETL